MAQKLDLSKQPAPEKSKNFVVATILVNKVLNGGDEQFWINVDARQYDLMSMQFKFIDVEGAADGVIAVTQTSDKADLDSDTDNSLTVIKDLDGHELDETIDNGSNWITLEVEAFGADIIGFDFTQNGITGGLLEKILLVFKGNNG